ncbi:kelch-like protein 6 isoform X2 [Mercenaria mercenaria]|nr:kelch-like protein 6 isoform X2 [Mercenaria mercenaria]XP_045175316.2 kelch-like protein 6 isoform X2 [Mercenaria mercenaria]
MALTPYQSNKKTIYSRVENRDSEMERMSRHRKMFSKGLNEQRLSEKYTDFTVVSDDQKEFQCHKVVLAAVSPFFDTMFQNEMQEMQLGKVDLPFSAETIDLILQYIYTGQNVITDQNAVPPLYYAANYLQIAALVCDCEEFLSKGSYPDISLEIWQVAKNFGNQEVAEIAKSVVLQNFSIYCDVDSIGRIGIEDLKVLLQDKMANCSGTVKCKAAWIWLVAQDSADTDVARNVIGGLVASENVDNEDILDICQNDWDVLVASVDFERLTFSRTLWETACKELWIQPEKMLDASHMSLNECLIVVGGTPLEESRLTLFNFKRKVWYDLEAEKKRELGHRYALCSLGSFLYLSGGTKNQKGFMCFNADTKTWDRQEDLPVGREQHIMCTVPENTIRSEQRTVERKIYVLGGTSQQEPCLKDVHVYDIGRMVWSKCGDVAYAVAAACSTVVSRRIYLLGGALITESSPRTPSDVIQCFDTSNGYSWKIDLKLPFKAKSQKMEVVCFDSDQVSHQEYVVYNKKIYKLKFDKHNGNIEEACTVPNSPTKSFAVSNFGDKFFIFGGEDDSFKGSKDMLQYDIKTRQIVTLPIKTPFEMKDFVHTKIPVPESWVLTELSE